MNRIVDKEFLSENVVKIVVEAPLIAKSRKPGNFIILRVSEKGERIPLTIASANEEKGTIDLIAQKVGVSTEKLARMEVGDSLHDLVGPLGKATEMSKIGTILACGGGVGIAPLLP
ncbi:MAG: FAD-binding oxidoreductase, partial [Prolixibacteraceae bacterium]|nr:FAD-binding oxidoreductase [Prolixibacteraceae bacterium]